MENPDFTGLGVALITPFKADNSIDYEALGRLIDKLLQPVATVDYILVMGTTAETPTLSPDERTELKRFVCNRVAGRVPLVLGVGGNNTNAICKYLTDENLQGYDAILSVVPFYNKPNQRGMYAHFAEIAKHSPLPIILYNIPGRTGVNMLPDTVLKLANDFDNIIAVKEASGNLEQITDLINRAPKGFAVISGDDGLTHEIMSRGGKGVISVLANAALPELKQMTDLLLEGKTVAALQIDNKLKEHYSLLFKDGSPAGIKCMLHHMGLIENILRLPLVSCSEEVDTAIQNLCTAKAYAN